MPRSKVRPQVGTELWYYGAAPPGPTDLPQAAIVVNVVQANGIDRVPPSGIFDLTVFNANGSTAPQLGVPFHFGTRPDTGPWCTPVRVNMPAPGEWPTGN